MGFRITRTLTEYYECQDTPGRKQLCYFTTRDGSQCEIFDNLTKSSPMTHWSYGTYAAYGRAVHVASVLEAHLAFALILGDFVKKITIKAERMGGLSQKQYQSELAAYKKKLFGKTMGQMIRHTRTLTLFDYALRVRLAEAKKRRNFLVHHFWQERLMCSVHESPAPGGGRPKGKTKSICRPLGLS